MNLNYLFYLLGHFFGIERHVKSLAIVHCFDENTSIEILNFLSSYGYQIFSIPINKLNATQATTIIQEDSKGSNLLGVFLDYECNSSAEFVVSVSTIYLMYKIPKNNVPKFFLSLFSIGSVKIVFERDSNG